MTKKKVRQREPAKPPEKTRYEDTDKFKSWDRLMRKKASSLPKFLV